MAKRSSKQGVLVLTTVAKPSQAHRLAKALVEERLCGCVSIVPKVHSLYRWNGRIESSGELLLLLKTTRQNLRKLEQRLGALHPYQVPEMLVLEPLSIAPAYARWLAASMA